MFRNDWLFELSQRWFQGRKEPSRRAPRVLAMKRRPAKPMLEVLEDRLAPASYSLTDLGALTAGASLGSGEYEFLGSSEVINSAGQVIGNSSASNGSSQAVRYSNGQTTNLGTLGGFSGSEAVGINNSGQVVGTLLQKTNGTTETAGAFLYSNGQMSELNGLISAAAINDSGQIAGYSSAGQAALYSNGTVTNLGSFSSVTQFSMATGVNASGQVVGFSDSSTYDNGGPNTENAFFYSNGKMIDLGTLPGDTNSQASAINSSGQVVGESYSSSTYVSHAFLYSNGQMTDLGTLSGDNSSEASGINSSGQVVGESQVIQNEGSVLPGHAFLYSNGQMTDLNSLLPAGTAVTLTAAYGINDNGQIVAQGKDGHLYLLTPQQTTGTVISNGTVSPTALTVSNRGQQVTVSATVNTDGSPATSGNVVFSLVGSNGSVVSDGPTGVAIGSNGKASDTLTVPGGTAAGAYSLQVAYTNNNQTTTQTFTGALTVQAIPVNVALSNVSPVQFVAGSKAQAVTATATVAPASGSGSVSEGTVTFTLLYNATPIGQPVQVQVVNGKAQLTSNNPLVVPANTHSGTYTLRAVYTDAKGTFASNQPGTDQLTITSPPSSKPSPTPGTAAPPSIPDQIQQLVEDVALMEQDLLSGDIAAFGQELQDYASLFVNVELEIFQIVLDDLAQILSA